VFVLWLSVNITMYNTVGFSGHFAATTVIKKSLYVGSYFIHIST
jgi:hypothetical protein